MTETLNLSCAQVSLEIDETLAIVTIKRPEKLNVLTAEMVEALYECAESIESNPLIRSAILTAEGEKAFCTGADIRSWSALEPLDMWRHWVRRGHQVFDRWAQLRVPVIAAINGHALGGGLELAAVADIRIGSDSALFGLPETTIAACPGWSGTQRLSKLIGASRVKYLALTGTSIDAKEALRIGLLHEIVERGGVMARAREIAARIAKLAPVSVQLTKQLIDAGQGDGMALALESMAGALAGTTVDAREGIASFCEKRQPRYKGK